MQPPIADPRGTPKAKSFRTDAQAFRFRFGPFFLWTMATSSIVVVPILAAIIYPIFERHPERFAPAMAIAIAATTLWALFVCALFYWFAPIRVNHWGMRAFSYCGSAREIVWTQMIRVRLAWLLCPYLVVELSDGRKLWLVWPIQNPRDFAQAVAAHTPPNHPLHAFLRQRGLLS